VPLVNRIYARNRKLIKEKQILDEVLAKAEAEYQADETTGNQE